MHPSTRIVLVGSIAVLGLFAGVAPLELNAGQARSDIVGVEFPVTPERLAATVRRLCVLNRTACGAEIVLDGKALPLRDPRSIPQQSNQVLDLTGVDTAAALEKLTALPVDGPIRKYEWNQAGNIFHVRPAGFAENKTAALNRVWAKADFKATGVIEALCAVHRFFDPSYPERPSRPPSRMPDDIKKYFEKPVTVSMVNATVRSVLDEIARNHGTMSWIAEYRDPSGGYPGLKLSFLGFDKWNTSATANVR